MSEQRKTVDLTPEQFNIFHEKLIRQLEVKDELEKMMAEVRAMKKFLKENGSEIITFISSNGLKKLEKDGRNFTTVNKTLKPKETSNMIYDAISNIYDSEDMISNIKKYIDVNFIKPKTRKEQVLKIVKHRKKRPAEKK